MSRLKHLDPGLVVVLLLATLAAWPFVTRASLPTFTDAELHVYRTYEILSAWQAGVPYTVWAHDFFYGFGYPVFNYYSPLTYYLGAAYGTVCCGVAGAVAGVKFVLVLAIYLGAFSMYLLVRDQWDALAGVVSAAAFTFAPYIVYIDPHARGDSPETFGIAVAVCMLWAFSRLRRNASPSNIVLAAVSLAVLILSHNLMALVFFGFLLAWLAWEILSQRDFLFVRKTPPPPPAAVSPSPKTLSQERGVGGEVIAILLGLALAAFMWLPAALERNAVQFRNVAGGTFFDYHRHFVEARELFAPVLIFDFSATEMRFNHNLGVGQWLLAALGLLTLAVPRLRRPTTLFFGLSALGLVYLITPPSTWVWEAIPPMAYLQFPTRILGPAAVVLAILAGAAMQWVTHNARVRLILTGIALALCIVPSLPLLYPPLWPDFGPVTSQTILTSELNGRSLGTTSANDFLPVGVVAVPRPQMSLVESYATGHVDKLNRVTLPPDTQVENIEHGPLHDRWRVTGTTDFVLRPFTFYWPGWKAYVDGLAVPIELAQPDGWITFHVPAGTHDVLLRLEPTPPRIVGAILSGLALAGLLTLGVWSARGAFPRPSLNPLGRWDALTLGVVAISFIALRFAADKLGWWRVRSTGNTVLVAEHQRYTELQNNIALLAFDLPRPTARPGDKVSVTLYWQTRAKPPTDYRVFVHLVGPDGQLWGQSDKWNPADFPMGEWPFDRYVRDEHTAVLRPDAPPGTYTVLAGLWDPDTGERLRVLDASGQPTDADSVLLSDSFVVK